MFDTMDALSRDHSVKGTLEALTFGLLGVRSLRQYGKNQIPDIYQSARDKFCHVYSGDVADEKVSRQQSSLIELSKTNKNVPAYLKKGKEFVPHPELQQIKDSNYIEIDGKVIKVGGKLSNAAYNIFQKMKTNPKTRGLATKIDNANLTPDHSGINIRQTYPLDDEHKLFMNARIGIGESMSSNRNGVNLGFIKIKDGLPSGPSISMVHGKVNKDGVLKYVEPPNDEYKRSERVGMLVQHGISKTEYEDLKNGVDPYTIKSDLTNRDLWGITVERTMTIPNSIKRSHNIDLEANQMEYVLKELNQEAWQKGFLYSPVKNNCHMFANDLTDAILGIPSNKFPHSFSASLHDRQPTGQDEYWKLMSYHWQTSLDHYRPALDVQRK